MTGAFVCAALSTVPTVRYANYLASWLKVLREDNRAIIRAASAASKAADYLLTFRIRDLDAPDLAGDASPLRSPEDPTNPLKAARHRLLRPARDAVRFPAVRPL
jgi:Zincin-like metallopeptidase